MRRHWQKLVVLSKKLHTSYSFSLCVCVCVGGGGGGGGGGDILLACSQV